MLYFNSFHHIMCRRSIFACIQLYLAVTAHYLLIYTKYMSIQQELICGASPPPPVATPLEGVQVRSLLRLRGVLLLGVAGGLHLQATCWLSWPVRATLSRHQLLQQALQERAAVRPLGASSATPSPQARASKWRSCGSPCTCMPVQPGSDRSGTHPCSWPTRRSACSGTPRRWQPRAPA